MAKTIMVSNRVYDELKKSKGSDKSFSDVIDYALKASELNRKTVGSVLKFAGVLEGDIEYEKIRKWSNTRWKEWSDKYA